MTAQQNPASQAATAKVADAVEGSWVNTHAPEWAVAYLQLSRLDRPIGSWLLLLPCWWGLFLASAQSGEFGLRDMWIFGGCAIGAILMRGAGCTWNDITDRKLDASVARTRSRPLPSGRLTTLNAYFWLLAQLVVAFLILVSFNRLAIALGVLSLLPVAFYPFAKRFTWWPQVFLGIAFNWGALLAWAAHGESLTLAPALLYLGGIMWTLFYDTIYAHQDRTDDELVGIKSTARLFGDATPRWLHGFGLCATALLAAAVATALVSHASLAVLIAALLGVAGFAAHLLFQAIRLDINDPASCLSAFRSNRNAGLALAVFLALAAALSAMQSG
ncbi:MAG: 4-hydroxybenzoate octaprenyltransferase [Rhodobacteraceae bacterium]|nr:4-hydroxybenzoate octaprenyltransferase [Paracoccaceae bacterium]